MHRWIDRTFFCRVTSVSREFYLDNEQKKKVGSLCGRQQKSVICLMDPIMVQGSLNLYFQAIHGAFKGSLILTVWESPSFDI